MNETKEIYQVAKAGHFPPEKSGSVQKKDYEVVDEEHLKEIQGIVEPVINETQQRFE